MRKIRHPLCIRHYASCIAAAFAAANAMATTAGTYTGDDIATWTSETASGLKISAGETVSLTNGAFELASTTRSFGDGSTLEIRKDATLTTTAAEHFQLKNNNARIDINGGSLSLPGMDNKYAPFDDSGIDATSGAEVDIRNGGTFSMTGYNSFFYVSGMGNRLLVRDGATLSLPSSAHVARSFKLLRAKECVVAVSNATVNTFYLAIGDSADTSNSLYNNSLYNGNALCNTVLLHNATISMADNSLYGLHLGYCGRPDTGYSRISGWNNHSFSNLVEITGDGSVTTTLKGIHMNGYADTIRLSSGKLNVSGKYGCGITLAGTSNRFEHAGGTLTADRIRVQGEDAVFDVCGGTNTLAVTLGGAPTAWCRGSSLLVSSGRQSGEVVFNGSNHFARVTGGAYTANISLAKESNSFFVDGGAVTGQVSIAGRGNTLSIGPGAELYNDVNIDTKVLGLEFASATNCTLVISNGTFTSRTSLAGSAGSVSAWWINCPGSAIEFRGRSPSFVFPQHGGYWQQMYIGRDTEAYPESAPLPDPVKLRFIPPFENFAATPLRNEAPAADNRRNIAVYGNAVIEVSDKEMPRRSERTSKMRVPLIYCRNSFYGMLDDATRMERLNANAILPKDAKLVYDSSGKTLYCELPSCGGTIIFVR